MQWNVECLCSKKYSLGIRYRYSIGANVIGFALPFSFHVLTKDDVGWYRVVGGMVVPYTEYEDQERKTIPRA